MAGETGKANRQVSAPAATAPRARLPDFVEPCLAQATAAPPSGAAWAHEIKFDGYRLQARIDDHAVRLLTRSGQDWTHRFRSLAEALRGLPAAAALVDGEVVVQDERGVSSFAMLVEALKAGRSGAMTFHAFDLLHLDGVDVGAAPLLERKQVLQALLARGLPSPNVRYSDHFAGDGVAFLREACAMGLEGIVSKHLDKPYRSGRHAVWLKSKCLQSDEFVLAGYLHSTAEKEAVGALALAFFDGDELTYAGRVGTGFDRRTAHDLWQRMQPLRRPFSPLSDTLSPAQRRGVLWLEPRLVAQVSYTGWTSDRLLRHAVFLGVREDKSARQVRKPELLR